MNVSSDALKKKRTNDEHARIDDQDTTCKPEEGQGQQEDRKGEKASDGEKSNEGDQGEGREKTGSKAAIVMELMSRKEGATLAEITKATDWQNHSILAFVSGHVIKKMGLKVESTRSEAGERTYKIVK